MKKNPILLADSGSTKADWLLLSPGSEPRTLRTQGLNPYMLGDAGMREILRRELLPGLPPETAGAVHFYGAGCRGEGARRLAALLTEVTGCSCVTVETDLLAAARATCGREAGWAAILGTGSNSSLYDGRRLTEGIPALGYVLGDEGSGAALGRRLLADAMKRQLPADLAAAFEAECGTTVDELLRRVYREPLANRFLASFAPFLSRHRSHPAVQALLAGEFRRFFRRNLAPLGRRDLPVGFVGSVAWHFADELRSAAHAEGYRVASIERSPLDGLRHYHGEGTENS